MAIKEALKMAFVDGRSEFDRIPSRCEEAFEEWYNNHDVCKQAINRMKMADDSRFSERLMIMVGLMTDKEQEHLVNIIEEYHTAKAKHPNWPADIVHCAAIVAEEAGELVQAALNKYYGGNELTCNEDLTTEAIQTGAMGLRFLIENNL